MLVKLFGLEKIFKNGSAWIGISVFIPESRNHQSLDFTGKIFFVSKLNFVHGSYENGKTQSHYDDKPI